ncbi:hypothetical protein [Acidiferrobacter thiooxydans]|uniref:Uncharacterized protein n=1 Tax=Acidiferrobacter thiooxydans TaxID=163359 RepID=A0A1C2G551_9GAMM|nr:hypothetical protein [Acidiferrobacter thiooxydans]MDA8191371.1 hypothetical protein [Gammaproteobacteria bacterium]RCN56551.1 hypothetical protein C4900_12220 [Acidiferrobacter thiooxydans]UEN99202.1 hypothetical protein A9R16_012335 [Acidiferrobacter thiooxydans]
MDDYIDPQARCPGPESLRPDAVIIEGRTHNGHACRIIDNTCSVARKDLVEVLDGLIAARRFGMAALSARGGQTLVIGRPEATHVQFGDTLYRLLLYPYEARIERF